MGQLNLTFPCDKCGELITVDAMQSILDRAYQGTCPNCGHAFDLDPEAVSEPDEGGSE